MKTNFKTVQEYDNLVNELHLQVCNRDQLYQMVVCIFTRKGYTGGELPRPISEFVKIVLSKVSKLSLLEKYEIYNGDTHVIYEFVQDIYVSINKTEDQEERTKWSSLFDRKNSKCRKELIDFVRLIVTSMIDEMEEAYEYLRYNGFIQMIADAAKYQAETDEEKKNDMMDQDPLIPIGIELLDPENEYFVRKDGSYDSDRLVADAVRVGNIAAEEVYEELYKFKGEDVTIEDPDEIEYDD